MFSLQKKKKKPDFLSPPLAIFLAFTLILPLILMYTAHTLHAYHTV